MRLADVDGHQNIPFWWWGFFIFDSSKNKNFVLFFFAFSSRSFQFFDGAETCITNVQKQNYEMIGLLRRILNLGMVLENSENLRGSRGRETRDIYYLKMISLSLLVKSTNRAVWDKDRTALSDRWLWIDFFNFLSLLLWLSGETLTSSSSLSIRSFSQLQSLLLFFRLSSPSQRWNHL